jgi:hypothetical protein
MTRSFTRMYSHPARARASFLLFTEAAITFSVKEKCQSFIMCISKQS